MASQVSAQESLPLGVVARRPRLRLSAARRFARRQPLGAAGAAFIVLLVLAAIFVGQLHTSDPRAFGGDVLTGPSRAHWFGTNRNGQDLWSRVLYGARPSLFVGTAT